MNPAVPADSAHGDGSYSLAEAPQVAVMVDPNKAALIGSSTAQIGSPTRTSIESILKHEADGRPRMGVGRNTRFENAIIDKEVNVPPGSSIGYDLELDKKRFTLTASGIVIVAKKSFIAQ